MKNVKTRDSATAPSKFRFSGSVVKEDWRIEKLLIEQELSEQFWWHPEKYGIQLDTIPSVISEEFEVQRVLQRVRISRNMRKRIARVRVLLKHK